MKKVLIALVFSLLTTPFLSNAQLATSGSETLVNTTTANNQLHPAVGMDSTGNYTLVWESQGQDGDGYGIYRAVYQNDGTLARGESIVNPTTSEDQRFPDVAMNASGEAVVVWQSYDQDGDSWGVYRRKYNSTFGNSGGQGKVNSTTTGRQCMPKVGIDEDLNYFIVWESEGDIYGRLYGDGGGTAKGQFQINTMSTDVQNYPDVAMNANGEFVVVWQSYDQDGEGFGIYSQRFDNAGNAQDGETLVNTTTSGHQTNPVVSIDSSGVYIVVWTDSAADGDGKGIFGQLFHADGTSSGTEFQVNTTTTGTQKNAAVAMTSGGAFSIAWDSYGQDGQYAGVYNQSYNSDGTLSGTEILVNTTTDHFQQFPAIAIWESNEAILVWQDGNINESNSLDTEGYGVVFQRYDATALPVELLYFYGEKAEAGVQLYWQTAAEINNAHFEVEWSTDGFDFQKIAQVQGAGTTSAAQFYDYLHRAPLSGNNYYRLQQVDFDGKKEYSKTVTIDYRISSGDYRIFPNPTADFIRIENGSKGELAQLFNATGHLVETFPIESSLSNHTIAHLVKGIYFLNIGNKVKRLLIQ